MKLHRTTYGAGGVVVEDVYEVVPGLGSDRPSIPPDGVTAATLNYYTTDPAATTANWSVNGVAHSEPLVNGVSEIEVTAVVAGSIVVTCNNESLTLTAE